MARHAAKNPLTVMTVGHSTWSLEAFIRLLRAHAVKELADVRTIPRSRYNPQFNQESLPKVLKAAGIGYTHIPELGGLRRARRDSPNTGWRNTSFRGFADYMQTPEFAAGIKKLLARARRKRVAIMCAEAVPWRCHRSLIADALWVQGCKVEHIMSEKIRHEHALTPWARVQGVELTYPPETLELDFKQA